MSTRLFVVFNSIFGQFANVFYLQAGRKLTEVACNTQKGFKIHTAIIRRKNSFKQKKWFARAMALANDSKNNGTHLTCLLTLN